MDLEIADETTDGWTVLTASGEIDVAAAPELRDRLTALVDEQHSKIVVDMEDVDFIDSTGLGVLVGAVRRARGAEGDLRLVCTNTRILKVFGVTGLDDVFSIHDTIEAAVAGRTEA